MSALELQDGERLLKASSVMKMLDLPKSTFYDLREKGVIPKPVYTLGESHPRYLLSEIQPLIKGDK